MNKCLFCGKETKNAKFCNRSCSASFNNKGVRRHGKPVGDCINCGKKLKRNASKYCSSKCQKDYEWKIFYEECEKGNTNGFSARRIKNI